MEVVGDKHGVSKQAVWKHVKSFHRTAAAALAERCAAVVTATERPDEDEPDDEIRATARAYIHRFEALERLMCESPVPPSWRTARGRIRGGLDPRAMLGEAGMLERREDGRPAKLTAGLDTIDLRLPGYRGDSLYRDWLGQRELAAAPSAVAMVLLDDEAPCDLLVPLGLVGRWTGTRRQEGRRWGHKRQAPRWAHAIDPETAADSRGELLAQDKQRQESHELNHSIFALLDRHG